MSDININLNNPSPTPLVVALALDRATVERSLNVLTKTLAGVAVLTNNEFLKRLSVAADQFLSKPWFVDLVMEILQLVNQNAPATEYNAVFAKYGVAP